MNMESNIWITFTSYLRKIKTRLKSNPYNRSRKPPLSVRNRIPIVMEKARQKILKALRS